MINPAEILWLFGFIAGIVMAVKNHRELMDEIKEGKWKVD